MAKADSVGDSIGPAQTLKRQARRRLVGALILGSLAAVSLPLLLDHEPRYLRPEIRLEAGQGQPSSQEVADPAVIAESSRKVGESPALPAQTAPSPSTQPAAGGSAARADSSAAVPRVDGSGALRHEAATNPRGDSKGATRGDSVGGVRPEGSPAMRNESSAAARPEPQRQAGRGDAPPAAVVPREPPRASQPPPSMPAQTGTSVASAASGNHVLQLGAFAQPAGARAIEDRAAAMGLRAWRETVQTPQGERIRVRVGPFPSRAAAEEVRSRLKAAGMDATLVGP